MCNGDSGYNYGAYLEEQLAAADAASGLPGWFRVRCSWSKSEPGHPKETEKGLAGCDGSNASRLFGL